MKSHKLRALVFCGLIAAVYTALTLLIAPLSFGMVQIRFSEALTILPALSPFGIIGVTLGCFLSNLIGAFTGLNPLGYYDILFGASATLTAAILSYFLRNIKVKGFPVLSPLPPILVNALIIGAELAFLETGKITLVAFAFNAALVGLGQLIPCYVLGLMLYPTLKKILNKGNV